VAVPKKYPVYVLRAWTKEGLAQKLWELLEPWQREEIVSVRVGVDFLFFWPFRRNWAIVVLEYPE
jgi:hypothetical protein